MSYQLIIDPLAQEDVEKAYRYFEDLQSGLGTGFLSALADLFDKIENRPNMFQAVEGDIRRGIIRRFQYAIFYRVIKDRSVLVLAIQHTSRQWGRWG